MITYHAESISEIDSRSDLECFLILFLFYRMTRHPSDNLFIRHCNLDPTSMASLDRRFLNDTFLDPHFVHVTLDDPNDLIPFLPDISITFHPSLYQDLFLQLVDQFILFPRN